MIRLGVLVVCLLTVFPSLPVVAEDVPPEPILETMQGWQPVRDRNVVVEFEAYEFKHPILSTPTPHPACGQIQVKGREVWLLTPDSVMPILYIIDLKHTAYRVKGQAEWIGTVGSTSDWIKDY
jgi:hypothetical protein